MPGSKTSNAAAALSGSAIVTGVAGIVVAVIHWLVSGGSGGDTQVLTAAGTFLSSVGVGGLVTHARTVATAVAPTVEKDVVEAKSLATAAQAKIQQYPEAADLETKVRAWVQDEVSKHPAAVDVETVLKQALSSLSNVPDNGPAPTSTPAASAAESSMVTPHLASGN